MEFTARTVTHPNPRISKEEAEKDLLTHPEFKPGTVVVAMTKGASGWVATLHEPKVAADIPPFAESDDSDAPSDEPKPPSDDEAPSDDEPSDDSESSDEKDKPKSEKAELAEVIDLVKQIAQAVGVPVPGDGPELGPEGDLGAPPHPEGKIPGGPEGGSPHDETSEFPGGAGGPGGDSTKQIIHRKAPPGAVPIGAPAFASVQQPKVASFELSEEVPEDLTLTAAKLEIESLYGPYGYKVKKIAQARTADGKRVVRAKVSVR